MLGSLNQRAVVRAHTLTPDGGGGYSESWDVIATVWARLEPITGADRFSADKLESRVRHKIVLRRSSGFAAGQRIEIASRIFAVRALLDPGAQSPFIEMLCEELP